MQTVYGHRNRFPGRRVTGWCGRPPFLDPPVALPSRNVRRRGGAQSLAGTSLADVIVVSGAVFSITFPVKSTSVVEVPLSDDGSTYAYVLPTKSGAYRLRSTLPRHHDHARGRSAYLNVVVDEAI